ncbi:TPR Domain containing protein [Pyrenophora tritici-repentis]|uniref:Transcription factor tfiiic complex subunit sfc4 n=1 Tax=Pyrenophora tritici-repentis TaxID=45151 RepID=A0A5M9KS17_9PLEO|nr:TPR Domain containing protein [Pyrenophora tritici-repentis]KAF7565275.1 transcription factor tfiiic complex subunit sfc4 [Pyrenophora tritici-repentis]
MNPNNGFYGQWPPGQPPNNRRYLPVAEDLEDEPPPPFTSSSFHDPFNRAYATSGPAVFEGFIPDPTHEEEEDEYANTSRYPHSAYDRDFESSDDEQEYERMIQEEEERERLLQIENKDDSEVDADYSSEDAQQDEGDPDEMELGVEFEDIEGRTQYRRGRGSNRGAPKTQAIPSILPASNRGRRGAKRGRGSSRGRGGYHESRSTRGRRRGKPGRVKGPRGPRPVADPGVEWKALQQEANARFIAKDYEAALEFAQRAIQLNPEIFDAYNIASEIYKEMGREEDSLNVLVAGAPTKRDPELWQYIIERIQKLDPNVYPQFTDANKSAAILSCLNEIILLNNDYEARSLKLEIEAQLGRSSKCVGLGIKMLKTRKEQGEDPDTSVLKIMAMMGTSTLRQTRLHLRKLITHFEEAIDVFTQPDRDPINNELDWELINIYLDLLDRAGSYSIGVSRLRQLSRWKQCRRAETFWDEVEDDREFDVRDEPRRAAVPGFVRQAQDATYGSTLPLEIRVKLGLFRLRKSRDDFSEAMRHLEMMEPDNHGQDAPIWDYEDLFRIIGDAFHATGHDQDALRFYEPLFNNNSKEFTLMSYMGLYTCFKNQGLDDKAQKVIPILKKWPADNYDDLAILAKFFEDQGMHQEAGQRAETIYRDKYGHKLKALGFQAYDELRVYYYNQRRQARGRYAVRKRAALRNKKRMQKATGQTGDDDDSTNENGDVQLPALAEPTERPTKGLFRTKRTKAPKVQAFLAVREEDTEMLAEAEPILSTIQGTGIPYSAIENRLFRRRIQRLATERADDLKAARAQHREIVSSFNRLEEIWEVAGDGDEDAIREVLSITRELIEEFSTFDIFFSNRKEDLTTYFRRVTGGDLWKDSALMVLAVVANNVDDGETDPDLRERPVTPPEDFWGIHFDKWCEAFGRYAMLLASEGDEEQCFATLDIATQANIFHRSQKYHQQLQLCRLACALSADNSPQASIATRWLLKQHPFGTDLFRLYSAANRLCSFPEGFSTGPAYKVLMRYVKTVDYALLTPAQRIAYNFRTTKASKGGFSNNFNAEDVPKANGHDPALFALYGHVLMCGGSYVAALNYYFRAYAMTPEDPVLNLCIAVAYVQHAMKRLSENRQYQIQQGLCFLYRYYDLRTKSEHAVHRQEAEFNVGRMWHALNLNALALPAYERCVGLSEVVRREAEDAGAAGEERAWGCEDYGAEAAFAMQSIYSLSGNPEAALDVTMRALVIE